MQSSASNPQKEFDQLQTLVELDRVSRVLLQASDIDELMREALEVILDIFQSDRAWLLFPCDVDAATWSVPMECTKPEYPGALAMGVDFPVGEEIRIYL